MQTFDNTKEVAEFIGQEFSNASKKFDENDPRKVRQHFCEWKLVQQQDFFDVPGPWMLQYKRNDTNGLIYNPLIKIPTNYLKLLFKDEKFNFDSSELTETLSSMAKELANVPLKEPLSSYHHAFHQQNQLNKLTSALDKLTVDVNDVNDVNDELVDIKTQDEWADDYNIAGQSIQFYWDTCAKSKSFFDDWAKDKIVNMCKHIWNVTDVIWEPDVGLHIEYAKGKRPNAKSTISKNIETFLSIAGYLMWQYYKDDEEMDQVSFFAIHSYMYTCSVSCYAQEFVIITKG